MGLRAMGLRSDEAGAPVTGTSPSGRLMEDRAGIVVRTVLVAGAFVLPLVFATATDDVFALPKTATMLAISLAILVGLASGRPWRSYRGLDDVSWTSVALGVYVALTALATIRSVDPGHSLVGEPYQYQGFLATAGYAVAFVAARHSLGSPSRLRLFAWAMVAAAGVAALYGLVQQAGLDPIWHALDKGRIFSTLGQANALAAYLILSLPLAVALWLTSPRRTGLVALLVTALLAIATALTLSRGGYLGALTALVVFAGCFLGRWSLTRGRLAVLGAVAFVVVVSIALVPPLRAEAGRIADRGLQAVDASESSAASHLDLWAVGARIAVDHPLLGIGPEEYPDAFGQYRDIVLSPARAAVMGPFRPESPHDVPLAIADGAGLPALAAYVLLVAAALLAGWRGLRGASQSERVLIAALLAAVVGHLVTELFMTAEVAGSWTFWALLGCLCSMGPRAAIRRQPSRLT